MNKGDTGSSDYSSYREKCTEAVMTYLKDYIGVASRSLHFLRHGTQASLLTCPWYKVL